MRKQTELTCPQCNKIYLKDLSEYNRNQKLGRESFCSLSCTRKARPVQPKNPYDISKHSKNKADKYTPFRFIMKMLNNSKRKENHLTLDDLKDIWETQNGICPYTNMEMVLPTNTNNKVCHTKAASLDRIDSSKPYQKDNVQFVIRAINFMKNNLSHEQTVQFLQQVSSNYCK